MTPRTILIVDDNKDIADLIGAALRGRGYSVLYAYDGVGAVMAARQHKPDLVVTDLMMPAANGATVYERLQSLPESAGRPFVFMSSMQVADVLYMLPTAENVRFIQKPVNFNTLFEYLAELLSPAPGPGRA